MKLVVLDGFLVGFDGLRPQLGPEHELVWYDHSLPQEIAGRIADADAVITNRTHLGEADFAAAPGLRYAGTLGTGYNIIDLAAAAKRGIPVCNAPGYSEAAVAQGAFALLLEIAGGTSRYNQYVHDGNWTDPLDIRLTSVPMMELAGKTMGIVGLGSIGSAVARIAAAFGMRVVGCRQGDETGEVDGVPLLPFQEVLSSSDVLSLHCPLSEETRGMIGRAAIASMKDGVILINTARGALLDEHAVADALDSRKIAWLGADVLATEPPEFGNPLATHPRTVITPHVSWMPAETRRRLLDVMTENFLAFVRGRPQNVVNPEVLKK